MPRTKENRTYRPQGDLRQELTQSLIVDADNCRVRFTGGWWSAEMLRGLAAGLECLKEEKEC